MTDAIKIGKGIYNLLINNTLISSLVGTKVFPLIAENDTTFPFIIYTRENIIPSSGTKDGYTGDLTTVRIDVVSDSYNENLEISNEVRKVLERPIINCLGAGLQLQEGYLSGIGESWDSNTYITQLRFTFVVKNLIVNTQQSEDEHS